MTIRPLSDRVVLKMVEAEETTATGIILTAKSKEKPQIAEVISVDQATRCLQASIQAQK